MKTQTTPAKGVVIHAHIDMHRASRQWAVSAGYSWRLEATVFGLQRDTAVVGAGYSWRLEATATDHVQVGTSRDIFEQFMSQYRPAEPLRGRISLPQIRHWPETCVFSTKSTVVDIPEPSTSLFHVPTSPRDEGDDDDWRHPRPE